MTSEATKDIIFLQNYKIWKQLLKYDLVSGTVTEVPRPASGVKLRGIYRKWDNGYVMFYKKEGALYFQFDGKVIPLEADDCSINFQRKGRFNLFQIQTSESIVFSHEYESLRYDKLNRIDPDFNEDREENQDFFLFIYNVMNDKERRNRMYSGLTDYP